MKSFLVDQDGYYGEFGGAYVPEILHKCVEELTNKYLEVIESEEFKKELCRNVQNMETAQDKAICLLEQHMVCSDPATVHVMNIMNRCMYGRDNMLIKDDMLCALWIRQEKEYVQHWLVRPLYERYGQEGWQSILPEISTGLTDREEEAPFVGGTLSYAACRSHMIIRPMNFARYQQDLGNAVYRKIGDLALVLHLLACEKCGSSLLIRPSGDTVLPWRLSKQQLLTEAMMNSCRKMPPRLFLSEDCRRVFPYQEGILLPDEDGQQTLIHPGNRREGHRGYLVTTTGRVNGAVAFFYPGVKDILAEKMGGDYYVAFPSVHEAIIHPVHCINVREIRTSVQRINAVYGDGEMLSDRIFCYHKNRRLLQLL